MDAAIPGPGSEQAWGPATGPVGGCRGIAMNPKKTTPARLESRGAPAIRKKLCIAVHATGIANDVV